MLPVGAGRAQRDWVSVFICVVWLTAVVIMFLSKLKRAQDLFIVVLLLTITAINNVENMVSDDTAKNSRLYKVFLVFQTQLKKECFLTCVLTTTLLNAVYWLQHHDINNFIGTLGWLAHKAGLLSSWDLELQEEENRVWWAEHWNMFANEFVWFGWLYMF